MVLGVVAHAAELARWYADLDATLRVLVAELAAAFYRTVLERLP